MHTRASLVSRLQASLINSADSFRPEDLQRHVDVGFAELCRFRHRTVYAGLDLQANVPQYPCPSTLSRVLACDWGRQSKAELQPWDDRWPGQLPQISVGYDESDNRVLLLQPAPTGRQLALLGSRCPYRYAAPHLMSDSHSSLTDEDAQLLILRAQAEAMRELAMHHASKPYQLRDGMSATPRNGMPGYLYSVLLEEFERRVCA